MSLALQGRGLFSGVLEGSQGRLHSPFPLSSSFVIYAYPPSELLPLLHPGVGSRNCSRSFVIQRCHRAGISWPRFLQSPFCHPKGHWRLAADDRSVLPQSFCSAVSLPHGDSPISPPIHQIWRLDDFSRPSGRLPPGSCPSGGICASLSATRFINFGFYALVCHPHRKSSLLSWPRSPPSCIVLGSGSFVIWTIG